MMLFRRQLLSAAVFAAAFSLSAAFAGEPDNSLRIDGIGQGLRNIGQSIGRRLDVTQLFDRPREPEEDAARDAGAASLRIDRLENQLRTLTGLVEELQHSVRRLEDQLRRAQETAPGAPASAPRADLAPPAAAPSATGLRRGDAFDPGRDPGAPGAPHPIGSTPPSAPLPAQPAATVDLRSRGAPLDLTHGRLADAPGAAPVPATPAPAAAGAQIAAPAAPIAAPQSPRDEFDVALARLRQGEYETAEKSFSAFLARNAKSKLAPQAIFYLGETYFQRERYREAAEKYLEISAKHANSPQGPEAMLRLGQSLKEIGAKEQACASFNEISVKYPSAPARVKEAAQQESKKVKC